METFNQTTENQTNWLEPIQTHDSNGNEVPNLGNFLQEYEDGLLQ